MQIMLRKKSPNGWNKLFRSLPGLFPQDELQKQQQQKLASDLKIKYGDYLLAEADGCCPFPGCGRQLTVSKNGKPFIHLK